MLLEVRNLSRRFGTLKAVDDVSFTVEEGTICGFVGPNGAGKTTTMRIVAGLDEPTAGEVFIKDVSVQEYPERTSPHLGFMPDTFAKYPNLTTEEYLDFFAGAYGLKGKEKRERVDAIIEFLGLEDLRQRRSDKLSKGMSQRLGLARTLIHDPPLLVLDEPAAGLDPRSRIQLRELLKILGSQGKGILVSSHILTELSEICDYVVIIEKGKLVASGRVASIMEELQAHTQISIGIAHAPRDPLRFVLERPRVSDASLTGSVLTVTFTGSESERADLLSDFLEAGFRINEFHAEVQDLEDLFLRLTDGEVQ